MTKLGRKDYSKIKAGHYDDAFTKGNKVQIFWHRVRLGRAIRKIPAGDTKILDIACGAGTIVRMLRKKFSSYKGVELSKKQIEYAKKKFGHDKRCTFDAKDAKKLTIRKESYDVIISAEFVEHFPKQDTKRLLAKTYQGLKKNGRLILTTPNYSSLWPLIEWAWSKSNPIDYTEQHINKYTTKRMVQELQEAGFKKIKIETIFIISPFFAGISLGLARWLLKIEQRIMPKSGSIMIVEARK